MSFRTVSSLMIGISIILIPLLEVSAQTPTRVVVRAASHDAKLLHDGVGGARITIRDAATSQVLDEGIQTGGSGDTELIMRTPRERGVAVYDTDGAAAYVAELMLDGPTDLIIEVEGPLGIPHAVQRATTTATVLPGRHVEGDGIVLVLRGFIVEIVEAAPLGDSELRVQARIRMVCGCPIEPGGLWDSDEYDFRAQVFVDGEIVAEEPMAFSGETSIFGATIPTPAADAVLRVTAADDVAGNYGLVERRLNL